MRKAEIRAAAEATLKEIEDLRLRCLGIMEERGRTLRPELSECSRCACDACGRRVELLRKEMVALLQRIEGVNEYCWKLACEARSKWDRHIKQLEMLELPDLGKEQEVYSN